MTRNVPQELQKQDKRNHEAYIRSGEVFEDREKSYEKAVKAWERGWASVTQCVRCSFERRCGLY